jgi:chromosome segregation ATPase
MENDQLQKQIEWLDKERIEDKNTISELQKQVESLVKNLEKYDSSIKELNSDVSRLNVVVDKVDKFETTLTQNNANFKKDLEDLERKRAKREAETEKSHSREIGEIHNTIQVFKSGLEEIDKMKKSIASAEKEDQRISDALNKVKETVEVIRKAEEKHLRIAESMEEKERRDAKRMADLQKEAAGFNKRAQEITAKFDLFEMDHKKFETRLNEILAAESERVSNQAQFKEEINRGQTDREHQWKDWGKRFTTIEEQSNQLSGHLENLSDAERAVEKAKASFEDISDQINRRINEITEMQRLGEERFRQEIATFKADDQKRWTNYGLTQEEMLKEVNRRMEKISDQNMKLADTVQDLQDILQHMTDQTEARLHTLIENLSGWAAEDDRFLSGQR